MRCQQCRRVTGDMVCQQCNGKMEELRIMKVEAAEGRREQLQKKISNNQVKMQQFQGKLQAVKARGILLAKINQKRRNNQALKAAIATKQEKTVVLQQKIRQHQDAAVLLQSQRLRLKDQQTIEEQVYAQAKEQLQCTLKCVIRQLHNKFQLLTRYLSMDAIQCCKLEEWEQFMSERTEQAQQEISQNLVSEEMALFLQMEKESTQKLARHLVRSIRVVNLLAAMHSIQLPFHTCSPKYKVGPSLLDCLYDPSKNRLNLSLLRLHQANTIYLYSRACITVHHPDVQEGRLQQLHQTFISRLKGFRVSPLSIQIRKPLEMMELEMDNLTAIAVSEQQYERVHVEDGDAEEEEELLMKQISEYIGFKSIGSSEDDEIQLLV